MVIAGVRDPRGQGKPSGKAPADSKYFQSEGDHGRKNVFHHSRQSESETGSGGISAGFPRQESQRPSDSRFPEIRKAELSEFGVEIMRARYRGICPVCRKAIKPGMPIIVLRAYCTIHEACRPALPEKPETPPPGQESRQADARTAAALEAAERAGFR